MERDRNLIAFGKQPKKSLAAVAAVMDQLVIPNHLLMKRHAIEAADNNINNNEFKSVRSKFQPKYFDHIPKEEEISNNGMNNKQQSISLEVEADRVSSIMNINDAGEVIDLFCPIL